MSPALLAEGCPDCQGQKDPLGLQVRQVFQGLKGFRGRLAHKDLVAQGRGGHVAKTASRGHKGRLVSGERKVHMERLANRAAKAAEAQRVLQGPLAQRANQGLQARQAKQVHRDRLGQQELAK